MPVYEYQCSDCGRIEEVLQKVSDPALTQCPKCNGHLKKLISHSAFHLKGTGWYVTDYSGAKCKSENKEKFKSTDTDSNKAKVSSAPSDS